MPREDDNYLDFKLFANFIKANWDRSSTKKLHLIFHFSVHNSHKHKVYQAKFWRWDLLLLRPPARLLLYLAISMIDFL